MSNIRLPVLPLLLALALTSCSGPAVTCVMPSLPGSGATETEWSIYRNDLQTYEQCLSAKAKSGAAATLDTIDSAADTTKDWVGKARSKL